MLLWSGCALIVSAANGLTVSEATATQGGRGTIYISLSNDDYSFTAFTFKLTLPDGVDFLCDLDDKPTYTRGNRFTDHSLSASMSGRVGTFACLSLTSAPIQGTNGVLLAVDVIADGTTFEGDCLAALLSEVTFTTTNTKEIVFDNVNFDVSITAPDDGRIHFDETSASLPSYTAGDKGDVTMKRTIKKDIWNTIVLPFNLTKAKATACFGDNVQFAQFAGFEVDYGDAEDNIVPLGITIKFSSYTIPNRGNLAGGTPVLIKTDYDITEIMLEDVTLTNGVKVEGTADEYGTVGKFTGSLVKTVVPADGLFISDNEFWYSTGKTNIKAFRGWFEIDAVLGKETDFGAKVRFVVDDVPTFIQGIESADVKGEIYTLQGIYVGKDVDRRRLPKGIYIIDGRKTFVK